VSTLVSIVIPSFENADHIRDTMRSVLGQTHTDLEVIVADHESSDGTLEILREFESDPRVRLLTTPAGGGAARNWNRVTAEAKGEYVKLVCGDDLIYPTCVAEQLAAFEDGVALVASKRDIVDARGKVVFAGRGLFGAVGRMAGRIAIRRSVRAGTNIFGEPVSVMFRRSMLSAPPWDPAKHYLIDQAAYADVLLRGDFVGVAKALAAFRVSGSQWSVQLVKTQAAETRELYRELAEKNPGLLSRADLLLGGVKASVVALGRRLTYLLLADRMNVASRVEQEHR
jgi:glycosyltransferase involved in cell wall biosynthesis